MSNNNYYVYVHCDPRIQQIFDYDAYIFGYEPFYIGKGKASTRRAFVHVTLAKRIKGKSTSHHKNKIRGILNEGLSPYILLLHEHLTHEEACEKEKELIALIGRKDQGNGPLLNLTNGGEGSYGRLLSEETRQKISLHHANFSGEHHPSFGMKRSEETRKRIGERSKGRVHSPETREKIRQRTKEALHKKKLLKQQELTSL